MSDLYLATGNPHKVEELSAMLAEAKAAVQVFSAKELGGMPEVDENADSFIGNARLKAQALAEKLPEGAWALADDSGLEVDALDGAPGIYSSRFAGESATDGDNLQKLLSDLESVEDDKRGAQFVCSLVLMNAAGEERSFTGVCRGRIIHEPQGEAGFGYDPVFVPDAYEESFAQLGDGVKSLISHRARALQSLIVSLKLQPLG